MVRASQNSVALLAFLRVQRKARADEANIQFGAKLFLWSREYWQVSSEEYFVCVQSASGRRTARDGQAG